MIRRVVRIVLVASSLLLAGGYIAHRVGALDDFLPYALRSDDGVRSTIMSGSKSDGGL